MDISEIKKILKQREPFLMLDRVIELNSSECLASKIFKENEYFFKGHFPENPVVPGVILIEALAQTASIIVLSEDRSKNAILSGVEKIKFKKVVLPNKEITLKARIKNKFENFYILRVDAKDEEDVVVTGEIILTVI